MQQPTKQDLARSGRITRGAPLEAPPFYVVPLSRVIILVCCPFENYVEENARAASMKTLPTKPQSYSHLAFIEASIEIQFTNRL